MIKPEEQLELDFPDTKELGEILDKLKEEDEELYKLISTLIEAVADTEKENRVLKELNKIKG